MAVEQLLAALERDAAAQAERLRAEARDRATVIIARAAADVDRRRELALVRLDREQRVAMAREIMTAERTLRAQVLAARAEVIERVFAEASRRLARAAIDVWESIAPGLVADTLAYLEGHAAVLRCPGDAAHRVAGAANGKAVTVQAGAANLPGVLGESGDGRVVVDNTLPGRLARMQDDLAIELSRRLEFEGACAGTT